jgi:hypothetical protein
MYPRLRMRTTQTTTIRKQLSAHRHPCLGFFSGKCYATPITLPVIGAASFLSIHLRVSRTKALLMASNTSYLSVYKVASALLYCVHASFVTCKCSAVLVFDLGYEGSTLLYFDY